MKALWRIVVQLFASVLILFFVLVSALPVAVFAQTTGSGTLTASPSSGAAPLAVTFKATWLDVTKTYSITYGDGNVSAPLSPQCALDNASSQSTGCFVTITHTYAKAGSFTATTAGYTAHVTVSGATATSNKTPPKCQIIVKPTSITIGGSVTVNWTSANATAGAITNIGNVGPTGSINLLPSSAAVTTYYGAFTGPAGTTNCQASVAVNSGSSNGGTSGSAGTSGSTGTSGSITNADGSINTSVTNTPSALGVSGTLPSSQGSSGLVPCGYGPYVENSNAANTSTGCQACSLVQLIQNIMTFAIGIAIPIAAALFAYAGFLYITSATKPANISKAKEIFKDALIGFLIAITAWLVINTLLHVIFNQGPFSGGNWFTIQCTTNNRPVSNKITEVLSSLPIVAGNFGAIQPDGSGGSAGGTIDATGAPTVGNGSGATSGSYYNNTLDTLSNLCDTNGDAASCNAANQFADTGQLTTSVQDVLSDSCDDGSGASCSALSSSIVSSGGGRVTNPQMAAQIASACAQYGNCSYAQRIALNESAGGNNCTTSYTGAAGCMQVLATTACGIDSSISSNCGACTASRQSLSAACAPVIQTIVDNPQTGTNLGVQYLNQLQNMPKLQSLEQTYGTCQIVAAAYYQGPVKVINAQGIPSNAVGYVNRACN